MTEQCPRLGKLFGGCKFRPRYDSVQAPDTIQWMMSVGPQEARGTRVTYICDVCETCGKTLFKRRQEQRA